MRKIHHELSLASDMSAMANSGASVVLFARKPRSFADDELLTDAYWDFMWRHLEWEIRQAFFLYGLQC